MLGCVQRAVAQVHQAEAALRAAIQYDEALVRNKASAKTGLALWAPEARGAPPGYTPASPMISRPQLLNPDVAAVGNYWFGQVLDLDVDKPKANGNGGDHPQLAASSCLFLACEWCHS